MGLICGEYVRQQAPADLASQAVLVERAAPDVRPDKPVVFDQDEGLVMAVRPVIVHRHFI